MSGHTPGPWDWRFPLGGLPELVCQRHGRLLVMDAVRYGFNRATLRFAERDPSDMGGIMHNAAHFFAAPGRRVPDIQVPTNPDMCLIAAAPDLLAACKRIAADGYGTAIGDLEFLTEAIAKAEGRS